MTREQAMKQARKRWGQQAIVRAGETITSPERREAALNERNAIRTQVEAVDADIKRLEDESGITALRAKRRTLKSEEMQAQSEALHYKFSVGKRDTILGAFFIRGTGDTWEEAFAKADGTVKETV